MCNLLLHFHHRLEISGKTKIRWWEKMRLRFRNLWEESLSRRTAYFFPPGFIIVANEQTYSRDPWDFYKWAITAFLQCTGLFGCCFIIVITPAVDSCTRLGLNVTTVVSATPSWSGIHKRCRNEHLTFLNRDFIMFGSVLHHWTLIQTTGSLKKKNKKITLDILPLQALVLYSVINRYEKKKIQI